MLHSEAEEEEGEGDGEREDGSEGTGLAGADFRRIGAALALLGFLWEEVDAVVVLGRGGLKAGVLRLEGGGMRSAAILGKFGGESLGGIGWLVSSVNIYLHAR